MKFTASVLSSFCPSCPWTLTECKNVVIFFKLQTLRKTDEYAGVLGTTLSLGGTDCYDIKHPIRHTAGKQRGGPRSVHRVLHLSSYSPKPSRRSPLRASGNYGFVCGMAGS